MAIDHKFLEVVFGYRGRYAVELWGYVCTTLSLHTLKVRILGSMDVGSGVRGRGGTFFPSSFRDTVS